MHVHTHIRPRKHVEILLYGMYIYTYIRKKHYLNMFLTLICEVMLKSWRVCGCVLFLQPVVIQMGLLFHLLYASVKKEAIFFLFFCCFWEDEFCDPELCWEFTHNAQGGNCTITNTKVTNWHMTRSEARTYSWNIPRALSNVSFDIV